jgi:hypothetical protein
MGVRRVAITWAMSLLTVNASAAVQVWAEPSAVCATPIPVLSSRAVRQDHAVAKSGRIPGLGLVSATIGWDNRKSLTLVGDDFTVSRTIDPLTREIEVAVSGTGEATLTIRLGGSGGLRISRSGRTVDPSVSGAFAGRAVAAFRERIGHYERGLIAGRSPARLDDPHADAFHLVGALMSSLAGDPTAISRARDLIMQRIYGKLRAVRFEFKDCVTDYEVYLLKIDTQRTQCLDAANDRDTWYARAADRLGCEAEFIAQALAGEGQFVSCTTLGAIVA